MLSIQQYCCQRTDYSLASICWVHTECWMRRCYSLFCDIIIQPRCGCPQDARHRAGHHSIHTVPTRPSACLLLTCWLKAYGQLWIFIQAPQYTWQEKHPWLWDPGFVIWFPDLFFYCLCWDLAQARFCKECVTIAKGRCIASRSLRTKLGPSKKQQDISWNQNTKIKPPKRELSLHHRVWI